VLRGTDALYLRTCCTDVLGRCDLQVITWAIT